MADLRARYWHSLEDYRACIKALKLLIGVFVRGLKMTWCSQRCHSVQVESMCLHVCLVYPVQGVASKMTLIMHLSLSLSLSLSIYLCLYIEQWILAETFVKFRLGNNGVMIIILILIMY